MTVLPASLERYRKFFFFMFKYWNSDLLQTIEVKAMTEAGGESSDEIEKEGYGGPEDLVKDLKEMGPTYIKLGQLLSTRPDLLPEPYLKALAALQDDVESIPFKEVQQIVEREIDTRISKAFQSFDEKPLASASIGQVHKAVLRSGKQVAVKIQRPGIREKFLEDLDTLKTLTDLAVKHSKAARKYAADEILHHLRQVLLEELDYSLESRNLITLGENLRSFEHILIPQPVPDYSTSRVLTMEFVEGQKITSIDSLTIIETDFKSIVDELVKAYLQQIIVDGFVHADPHPGNVHFTRDKKIALMDLGMVARFSPRMQEELLKLLIAISQSNGDTITDVLLEISEYDEDADLKAFRRAINQKVMGGQSRQAKDLETGRLLIRMNRIAADNGVRVAVQLNMLGKILLNMDQIVAVLAPEYDLQNAIRDNVQDIMQSRMKNELKPENLLGVLVETKRLAKNLPERLNRITERLASNEFEIRVNAIDEKRLTDGFQKVANRITLGLIVAALILGAAMLMRVPTTFMIWGYPGLPVILFLLSGIAGIMLAVTIIRRDEDFVIGKKRRK